MVNVNTFKNFVEFVANKVQVGNSVSPSQFNSVANQAQMQVFEKDYQTYLQSENISEFLKTFLENKTGSLPTNGKLSYPSDFQHIASVRSYYVPPTGAGIEVNVEEVKNHSWGEISQSQLLTGTKEFPKYSEFGDAIRFLPKNLGIVILDYFRTPVAPIWAYTISSGRPVYDASTSVNFEWSEYSFNNVAAIYLSLIGINLKDNELSQFSQMYKQETNSVL